MIIQRRLQPERINWHRDKAGAIRLWLGKLYFRDVLVINNVVTVKRTAHTVYTIDCGRSLREVRHGTLFVPGSGATQRAVARSVEDATALVVKLLDAA